MRAVWPFAQVCAGGQRAAVAASQSNPAWSIGRVLPRAGLDAVSARRGGANEMRGVLVLVHAQAGDGDYRGRWGE